MVIGIGLPPQLPLPDGGHQLPDHLDPCNAQQGYQQEGDQTQSIVLLPEFGECEAGLLGYVIREAADHPTIGCLLELTDGEGVLPILH